MRLSAMTALIATAAVAMAAVAAETKQKTMPICNAWRGAVYDEAKETYPEIKDEIEVVQEQGSVPWYTDNKNATELANVISSLSTCAENTKIPMVVYGIPEKDCDAGYSNMGTNKNFDDYKAFIGKLAKAFPTQYMIYIIEPDAVGLVADGKCTDKEYPKAIKYAIETLSKNPNAELYLDIGYWTLKAGGKSEAMAKVVNEVWPASGAVKGIALNTSNYQKTDYMIELCESFAKVTGKDMKCIVDTSRNNKGPSTKGEWCNVKNTGIGVPPTMDTGNARAAYYLWVKPPGESDGECTGQTSGDQMIGPKAGQFFKEHFDVLWKNGYFAEKGITKPGQSSSGSTPSSKTPSSKTPSTDDDDYTQETSNKTPKNKTPKNKTPKKTPKSVYGADSDSPSSGPAPSPTKKKCKVKRRTRRE